MLQSLLNSVDVLSPEDGHLLVVGDLWLCQADCQSPLTDPQLVLNGGGAGRLALRATELGLAVTLVGFVGDDELADAVEIGLTDAGVVTDLLHIKKWTTFTDVVLDLEAAAKTADANGRAIRRHKDERVLPIDGMSEYQAHLQNRSERYLRNAGAVVLVDYDLGSIAEPRALTYTANKLRKPCMAMLGFSTQAEKYRDARCYDLGELGLVTGVNKVMDSLKEVIG